MPIDNNLIAWSNFDEYDKVKDTVYEIIIIMIIINIIMIVRILDDASSLSPSIPI